MYYNSFLDTTWMEGNTGKKRLLITLQFVDQQLSDSWSNTNDSLGHLDPSWIKALVIDNGVERFGFVTMDAIGSDGNINDLVWLEVRNRSALKV